METSNQVREAWSLRGNIAQSNAWRGTNPGYNQTRNPQIRTASVRPTCRPSVKVSAKYRTANMTA